MALIGANAVSASVRLAVLVVSNRIRIKSGHDYEPPTNEEVVFLFLGCVAAFHVGLITIKDALPRVAPAKSASEPGQVHAEVAMETEPAPEQA